MASPAKKLVLSPLGSPSKSVVPQVSLSFRVTGVCPVKDNNSSRIMYKVFIIFLMYALFG